MSQDNGHFGTTADGDGFKHGLDEDNAMTGEVKEEDKQVNDPDVDTRPAEPVEHTSNVVGRRNPALPTEAPRGTEPAPGTSANGVTS